jgi:hypothetical protein
VQDSQGSKGAGLRVWVCIAASAVAAPFAAQAANAPSTFVVTVQGTVTIDATIIDNATYEGTSCHVQVTNTGHDTIDYGTATPMRVTVSNGKGVAKQTVPFQYHLSGSQQEGTPTGTLNGAPCPPLTLLTLDCRTYKGNLALTLKVNGDTVTVSSPDRPFQPSGLCPGAHSIQVPASSGKLPAKQVAVVNGTGTESSSVNGVSVQISSQFRARFARQ